MRIEFEVEGVPPKKDGANSMWGKETEVPRIIALRSSAQRAMQAVGAAPFACPVLLDISIYAEVKDGDIDNFIAGICDALQSPDRKAACHEDFGVEPSAIVLANDKHVVEIRARRLPPTHGRRYRVVVETLDQTE